MRKWYCQYWRSQLASLTEFTSLRVNQNRKKSPVAIMDTFFIKRQALIKIQQMSSACLPTQIPFLYRGFVVEKYAKTHLNLRIITAHWRLKCWELLKLKARFNTLKTITRHIKMITTTITVFSIKQLRVIVFP